MLQDIRWMACGGLGAGGKGQCISQDFLLRNLVYSQQKMGREYDTERSSKATELPVNWSSTTCLFPRVVPSLMPSTRLSRWYGTSEDSPKPKKEQKPFVASNSAANDFHQQQLKKLVDLAGIGKKTSMSNAAQELLSLPNALSLSRAMFGPAIAYWITEDAWSLAVAGIVFGGASDWLDGYIAKQRGQQSVLGSYLDPLADKILIGCVAGALVYRGLLPLWVAGTIVARDAFLITGTIAHHTGKTHRSGITWDQILAGDGQQIQPLFISKVNTALQLCLLGMCMTQGMMGWPGETGIQVMSYATVATTLVSWWVYTHGYMRGKSPLP